MPKILGFFLIAAVVGTLFFALSAALKGFREAESLLSPKTSPTQPKSTATPQPSYTPPATTQPSYPTTTAQPTQPTQTKPSTTVLKPTIEPPVGFTIDEISPFYELVLISSARSATSYNQKDSVALRADRSLDGKINITGWKLKTNKGPTLSIPQAISNYSPGTTVESDILLDSGETVNIFSNESPTGRNLRLNKCTGYLNNIFDFDPSLPKRCPGISRQDIISFSGKCQSLILSIRTCQEPSGSQIFSFQESVCRDFLQSNFTYPICYNRHRGDSNFFSGEWYVWLDKDIPLDSKHDRVFLLDDQGLLVDEYVY